MNSKQFAILILAVLATGISGWYFGKKQGSQSNAGNHQPSGHNSEAGVHSHGGEPHRHDHPHDHRDEEVRSRPDQENPDSIQAPPTRAERLKNALAAVEKNREENDVILRELLTVEEVRELYLKKIENPDLSLYDDNNNRLSEEAFIANWGAENGFKTAEMVANMEEAAWDPIRNLLNNQRRETASDGEREEEEETRQENNEQLDPSAIAEKRREIQKREADTIRAEFLTRPQIEALYDQKVSENSPEVIDKNGAPVPKESFVRNFVATYGELTPEMDAALDEYLTR